MQVFNESLSEKTKLFILNNPNNPTGLVMNQDELEVISIILEQFPNIIVISDDVYNFMVFEEKKEAKLFGSIRNNFERTISLFDGGKMFSATGWQVGWAIGPKHLI